MWEPLPYALWRPTIRSLHMWSQMVGKVRMALAAPMCHWWHVPLYVSARGLTTSAMPCGSGAVELEFDLRDHVLRLRTSHDRDRTLPLRPMSVARFYAELTHLLAAAHVDVAIWPVPVEVEVAIPFPEDTTPGGYDRAHARALHGALVDADRVLSRFRGRYLAKASPVQFFWGSFDLAVSRFSGRSAPRHPGGIPNCPVWVMEEAYSHEVSSAGWWPGDARMAPAFYAYMYPEPEGYRDVSTDLVPGHFDQTLGEWILWHEEAMATSDPDRTVLDFLQATYVSGAALAGWDPALEWAGVAATSDKT